jgi:hypothetical protein
MLIFSEISPALEVKEDSYVAKYFAWQTVCRSFTRLRQDFAGQMVAGGGSVRFLTVAALLKFFMNSWARNYSSIV